MLSCSAFAIVAGTLHHGSLWGCPLVYSTTIAPCGATELTSFAQVSSAQAGSGTACHVTMCPFAFTVDDSHTEGTGPRLPATLTGRGLRIGIMCNPNTGVVITCNYSVITAAVIAGQITCIP